MRRWWLYARVRLPWPLFVATRPPDWLVMDWHYRHGWGRHRVAGWGR